MFDGSNLRAHQHAAAPSIEGSAVAYATDGLAHGQHQVSHTLRIRGIVVSGRGQYLNSP